MKAEIIRRVKQAEQGLAEKAAPDVIIITYEAKERVYRIEEHRGVRVKNIYLNDYTDYIIDPNYKGAIFFDFMDKPENEGNGFFSVNMGDVKKTLPKGNRASLEIIEDDEENDINLYVKACNAPF